MRRRVRVYVFLCARVCVCVCVCAHVLVHMCVCAWEKGCALEAVCLWRGMQASLPQIKWLGCMLAFIFGDVSMAIQAETLLRGTRLLVSIYPRESRCNPSVWLLPVQHRAFPSPACLTTNYPPSSLPHPPSPLLSLSVSLPLSPSVLISVSGPDDDWGRSVFLR